DNPPPNTGGGLLASQGLTERSGPRRGVCPAGQTTRRHRTTACPCLCSGCRAPGVCREGRRPPHSSVRRCCSCSYGTQLRGSCHPLSSRMAVMILGKG